MVIIILQLIFHSDPSSHTLSAANVLVGNTQ